MWYIDEVQTVSMEFCAIHRVLLRVYSLAQKSTKIH